MSSINPGSISLYNHTIIVNISLDNL